MERFEIVSHEVQVLNAPNSEDTDALNPRGTGSAFTILYIEDNPANLRLVERAMVYRENIRLLPCAEPVEGMELALNHDPALILIDINLPVMSGYEVVQRLRQDPRTRHKPMIAVSANVMPTDITRGIDSGFDNYLTKPINLQELFEIIDAYQRPD